MKISNNTWPKWAEKKLAKTIREAEGKSLLRTLKLSTVHEFVNATKDIPGDIAELGVYRGGSAFVIATYEKNKTIHLFDTFAGLPTPNKKEDQHRKGQFAADLNQVKQFLAKFNNLKFYKGFFPDTAIGLEKKFSFVHVDADLYQSVTDAIDYFWPRMNTGGIILFDDYGAKSCPGAKKAVDEKIKRKVYLPTGQCFTYKL